MTFNSNEYKLFFVSTLYKFQICLGTNLMYKFWRWGLDDWMEIIRFSHSVLVLLNFHI